MPDRWRFIDSGPSNAFLNMAIDEAVAFSVRCGQSPPVLRVYQWEQASVSIGSFQKIASVNLQACSELGIPIVRRITGGRAVLHGNELTYSFSAPTLAGHFASGLLDSYRRISTAFCLSISRIGLLPCVKSGRDRPAGSADRMSPLCFQSASFAEISLGGKKVVGSAQKRWKDGLLQQGSVPFAFDRDLMQKVFSAEAARDIHGQMTCLKDEAPDLDQKGFRDILRASFEEVFGVQLVHSDLTPEEFRRTLEFESGRYRSPQWTHQR